MLTYPRERADTAPVAAKSVTGFGDSNNVGGHTAVRAVFLCLQNGVPCYGRAMREAFEPAGSPRTGSPTRMAPPTLLAKGGSAHTTNARDTTCLTK